MQCIGALASDLSNIDIRDEIGWANFASDFATELAEKLTQHACRLRGTMPGHDAMSPAVTEPACRGFANGNWLDKSALDDSNSRNDDGDGLALLMAPDEHYYAADAPVVALLAVTELLTLDSRHSVDSFVESSGTRHNNAKRVRGAEPKHRRQRKIV